VTESAVTESAPAIRRLRRRPVLAAVAALAIGLAGGAVLTAGLAGDSGDEQETVHLTR
jgi:hypothetical protein